MMSSTGGEMKAEQLTDGQCGGGGGALLLIRTGVIVNRHEAASVTGHTV